MFPCPGFIALVGGKTVDVADQHARGTTGTQSHIGFVKDAGAGIGGEQVQLRPVKQWNDGKQAEYTLRKTYRPETLDNEVSVTVVAKERRATIVAKRSPEVCDEEALDIITDCAQSA